MLFRERMPLMSSSDLNSPLGYGELDLGGASMGQVFNLGLAQLFWHFVHLHAKLYCASHTLSGKHVTWRWLVAITRVSWTSRSRTLDEVGLMKAVNQSRSLDPGVWHWIRCRRKTQAVGYLDPALLLRRFLEEYVSSEESIYPRKSSLSFLKEHPDVGFTNTQQGSCYELRSARLSCTDLHKLLLLFPTRLYGIYSIYK